MCDIAQCTINFSQCVTASFKNWLYQAHELLAANYKLTLSTAAVTTFPAKSLTARLTSDTSFIDDLVEVLRFFVDFFGSCNFFCDKINKN